MQLTYYSFHGSGQGNGLTTIARKRVELVFFWICCDQMIGTCRRQCREFLSFFFRCFDFLLCFVFVCLLLLFFMLRVQRIEPATLVLRPTRKISATFAAPAPLFLAGWHMRAYTRKRNTARFVCVEEDRLEWITHIVVQQIWGAQWYFACWDMWGRRTAFTPQQ